MSLRKSINGLKTLKDSAAFRKIEVRTINTRLANPKTALDKAIMYLESEGFNRLSGEDQSFVFSEESIYLYQITSDREITVSGWRVMS